MNAPFKFYRLLSRPHNNHSAFTFVYHLTNKQCFIIFRSSLSPCFSVSTFFFWSKSRLALVKHVCTHVWSECERCAHAVFRCVGNFGAYSSFVHLVAAGCQSSESRLSPAQPNYLSHSHTNVHSYIREIYRSRI